MSRPIGLALLASSTVGFAYVASWLLGAPFLGAGGSTLPSQSFFPDPTYAFLAAALVLGAVVVVAGAVVGLSLICHSKAPSQSKLPLSAPATSAGAGGLAGYSQWQFKPRVVGQRK